MSTYNYAVQKSALTRAVKSGDPAKVLGACRKVVTEWDQSYWPDDDWTRWQRALNDTFPVFAAPRLDDLR